MEKTMTTFEEMIPHILESEGGSKYTNDPEDPGGETKYGIAKRYNKDVDIKNLTEAQAVVIYKKKYWDKYKIEKLPGRLRYIYFDMVINPGSGGAGKILQRAANSKNRKYPERIINVDGRVGPATIAALKNVEEERVRSYRVLYYAEKVVEKPKKDKYWYGWFRRALRV